MTPLRVGAAIALLVGRLLAVLAVAHADAPREQLARERFDAGVDLAAQEQWQAAVQAFEASLREVDRPATRFNLVLAYNELREPLALTRHALAFLRSPAEPAHRAERARAEELLRESQQQLAALITQSLPHDAELRIDGRAPEVRSADRIFVAPGLHRLEARWGEEHVETIELQLSAGQALPWPRQGGSQGPVVVRSPAPPPQIVIREVPRTRARQQVAWWLGMLGVAAELSAVGTYAGALHRANALAHTDPSFPPFLERSDEYRRTLRATSRLAVAGAASMTSAVLLAPRLAHNTTRKRAFVALGIGVALLGAGLAFVIPKPNPITNPDFTYPTRYAGALCLSSAAPFLAYSVRFSLPDSKTSSPSARGVIP